MKAQYDDDRLTSDGAIWWTIDWQVKAQWWNDRLTSDATTWWR